MVYMCSFTVGKKLSDGNAFSGKGGGLTISKVDTIQSFFGQCIRRNNGNPNAMSKQVWAILNHYSSTPERPNHGDCPTGRDSWCSYNRDAATGESTHRPIKNPLLPAAREVMLPVFESLSRESFLEKCKECYTQNANESFNRTLWSLCPKEQFNSTTEVSLSVNLAVCLFNNGFEYTCKNALNAIGAPILQHMIHSWQKEDTDRILKNDLKDTKEAKQKRKDRKRSKCKKQDAFIRDEGVHYQSQGFYEKKGKQRKPSLRGKRKRGGKTSTVTNAQKNRNDNLNLCRLLPI